MKFSKPISMILITLTVVSAASCGETASVPQTTEKTHETNLPAESTTAEDEQDPRSSIKDNLPELDFNGQTIRFLHRANNPSLGDPDLRVEVDAEVDGEIVNAAIHDRTLALEERLNITIETRTSENDVHSGSDGVAKIRTSVSAGSDDYDIVFNQMSQMTPLAMEGMLVNLKKLDYLDFGQPWWKTSFMDEATLYGQLYFAAGDLCLSLVQSTYLMYYNKNLYQSYCNDDLYQTVWDGAWTFDKLAEISKTVYSDLNGNGTSDVEDRFGLVTTVGNYADAFLIGSGVTLAKRDAKGLPYFSYPSDETTFTFLEKISSILNDGTLTYYNPKDTAVEILVEKFTNSTALFTVGKTSSAASFRDMEEDFGVVPIPKLNEAQSNYITGTHNGFSSATVPVTCSCLDAVSATMEAMAAESYRTVTPAYYETALKIKYSRDDETSQMLDMISESVRYNFGYIYAASLNNVLQQFRTLIQKDADTAASTMASGLPACEAKLASLLEVYESMAD